MEEGMHDALPTDGANLSLRKMGDYQTTRLCVVVHPIRYGLGLEIYTGSGKNALRPVGGLLLVLLKPICSRGRKRWGVTAERVELER